MSDVLIGNSYECSCGKMHELPTKVVYKKGVINDTAEHIQEVFLQGNIAICTAKHFEKYSEIVQKGLISKGYSVRTKSIESDTISVVCGCDFFMQLPECVRFLLGIGGGSIADMVRLAAKKMEIDYALIVTSPSTDSYLSSHVENYNQIENIKCNYPKMLIIDDDIIDKAPSRLVASGYGRVVSQIVNIFDTEFNKFSQIKSYCGETLEALAREVHQFEIDKEKPDFRKRLMEILLKISKANEYMAIERSAVDTFSLLLTISSEGHTQGENSLIASYIVLNLYRSFLKSDGTDTLLPPDIIKTLKLLEKYQIINYNSYIKQYEVTSVEGYLKQTFILSEYRRDLYELINDIDIGAMARFWRRLYNDAGYWLKNYLTNAQLMRCLSLSAELSENTLLKHIKRIGFLEDFI
ncbi:MAG: iron-containing alcohol dehydrogenase [Clostridia bacterium]